MPQKIGTALLLVVMLAIAFGAGVRCGLDKATETPSSAATSNTVTVTEAPTTDLTPFPAFLPTPIPGPEIMEVQVYVDGQLISDERLAEDGAHEWAPVIEWEYSLEYRLAQPDQRPQKTREFLPSSSVSVPEGAEQVSFVAHYGGFRLQSEARTPQFGVPELVVLRYTSREH